MKTGRSSQLKMSPPKKSPNPSSARPVSLRRPLPRSSREWRHMSYSPTPTSTPLERSKGSSMLSKRRSESISMESS